MPYRDLVRHPTRGGGLSFAADGGLSDVAVTSSSLLAPSNPTQLVCRRQEASSIFSTPHNTRFYSMWQYFNLDHSHQEIRLLRIHPKRIYVSDLPQLFPQWNRPGTDVYKLMTRPKVRNPEQVDAPEPVDALYRSSRPIDYYRGSKPDVPDGWAAVKYGKRRGVLEGSHRLCSFADRLPKQLEWTKYGTL
jgi:hypothetical protein